MDAANMFSARLTIWRAQGGDIVKKFALGERGIEKTSAPDFVRGTAEMRTLVASSPEEILIQLGAVLDDLAPQEAIGLGVAKNGRPINTIVTKKEAKRLAEREADNDAIARAKGNFETDKLLLLDFDGCSGGRDILMSMSHSFAGVAMLIRPSSSAGVSNPSTGEVYAAGGEHIYLLMDQPGRQHEVLDALMRLSWKCGLGRIFVTGGVGSLLVRGPVDASVWGTERVIYEGAPIVSPPLVRHAPANIVYTGKALNVESFLNFVDRAAPEDKFKEAVETAKASPEVRAKAEGQGRQFVEASAERTRRRGGTEEDIRRAREDAERSVRGAQNGGERPRIVLGPSTVLYLQDGRTITVADVLDDPESWNGMYCADPGEPDYHNGSRTKAEIRAGRDKDGIPAGNPWILSYAHGGIDYQLDAMGHVFERMQNRKSDAAGVSNGQKPVIVAEAGEWPRMVDEAEQAIVQARQPVFARGGTLVRPVTDKIPASKGRLTTVAKLRDLCADSLLDLLSGVADFQRYDLRSKSMKTIDPPAKVASILLAREGYWRLPSIAGVITTPTMRPDGTLLTEPGYDPSTRLFLVLDEKLAMPAIKDCPTKADAIAALRLLLQLLDGFPFVGPVDRAVALSGLITAVVRGAMSAAPLHAIRANTPGTGKSLLVDIVSTIATGRPCPVIAAGKTEEETEKRLGALLRDGVAIVSIDNVNGELGGDTLCQMTERPMVRVRILGRSEAPEFECKATIFATGNGLVLLGDMTRRAVLCSLDANMERPELRAFDFDPVATVLANRGAYIAAALTIVRAYQVAGVKIQCGPLGSYGEWSNTVRSSLIWLGEADPVSSMEAAREEDPELTAIREFFAQWREHLVVPGSYTTSQIVTKACEKNGVTFEFVHLEFRDTLLRIAGDGGAVSTRRLGKWLSRISGRVVEGQKLHMQAGPSHGSRFTLTPALATAKAA